VTLDVSIVVGTRPEVIKCAPVLDALRQRGVSVRLVSTGQHAELLHDALAAFKLTPDVDLRAMGDGSLNALAARMLHGLDAEFSAHRPRLVLVQGDTTSTLCAALAAFYAGIPCAHIEAGLRSGHRAAPWPEEVNRQLVSRVATRHYSPTAAARDNLLAEGIDAASILVTGQTGVDAAMQVAATLDGPPAELAEVLTPEDAFVFITAHRRENHGSATEAILAAIEDTAAAHPDVRFIWAEHPSPAVQAVLDSRRDGRISFVKPVGYAASVWLIANARVVVTDSGGIQEEAPSFGTPVLVTRDVTERPEGVAAGFLKVVGTDRANVRDALMEALANDRRPSLKTTPNPYGDGKASARIADDVLKELGT